MAEPRIDFLIGGVQKGGTTALARCLAMHPQLALPRGKEAHVFDAPDFEEGADVAAIDARYAGHFEAPADGRLHGDATPIYCLHPRFVERIARYNPAMRWILLLRDPVERAISQYFMEHARGDEPWPLLPALLLERWRLRGHHDDFSAASPLRRHSYLLRGDYARQLDALYAHFPPAQVLLVRSDAFRTAPDGVLAQVCRHLAVAPLAVAPGSARAFEGDYRAPARSSLAWRLAEWCLRDARARLARDHGIDFRIAPARTNGPRAATGE